MTDFIPTAHDAIGHLLRASAWLPAGALIGAFHLLTLRWNVRMFAAGQWFLLPAGMQLIRFALMATMLTAIAAFFGALALLFATAGVLIVRTAIVRLAAQQ